MTANTALAQRRAVKIKNDGLDQDQYGAETFKQQQFGTAGVEGVIFCLMILSLCFSVSLSSLNSEALGNCRDSNYKMHFHETCGFLIRRSDFMQTNANKQETKAVC